MFASRIQGTKLRETVELKRREKIRLIELMPRDLIHRGSSIRVTKKKRNGICINSCIDGHSTEMSYCGATHSSGNANLESK